MNPINYFKNGAWKGTVQGIGMTLTAVRPEIELIFGAVSLLIGTIYACKKTKEAEPVIEEAKKELAEVKIATDAVEGSKEIVSKEFYKSAKVERGRQYVRIYGKTAFKLAKIYAVPGAFWLGGMGLVTTGHGRLKKINSALTASSAAMQKAFQDYRRRVADAVGEENEQKMYLGAAEGTIQVLEKDTETGEEKIVEKKADVFYAQPGSIFARNFNEETSDAFDIRSFANQYLQNRIDGINAHLETGQARAYTGLDILRMLGFNENALGEDEQVDFLVQYGISGNARKVPDPEMRKLKVTRLRGYQRKWDVARNMEVYVPCERLDFNFYPLAGKI